MKNPHSRSFHMRLTESEYQALHDNAKKAGLPLSTYMRFMIKGIRPKENRPVDWLEYNKQICGVAANLNQMALVLHRDRRIDLSKLDELMSEISRIQLAMVRELFEPEQLDKMEIIRKTKSKMQDGQDVSE